MNQATILGHTEADGRIELYGRSPDRKVESGDIVAFPGDDNYYRTFDKGNGHNLGLFNVTEAVQVALKRDSHELLKSVPDAIAGMLPVRGKVTKRVVAIGDKYGPTAYDVALVK